MTVAGRHVRPSPQDWFASFSAARDHGLAAAGQVDAGGVPERGGRGAGQPVDQPVLAVVVVHRERAVGGQVLAGGGQGLFGEQEALQPDLRGPGDQGQRVGQGEQDQVVLGVGGLQERPAVVDVPGDPRIVVGVVGVLLDARSP